MHLSQIQASAIGNLRDWIMELNECRKELIAEQGAYEAAFLPSLLPANLLYDIMNGKAA